MLKKYLNRLYDTIVSRGNIEIELLVFDDQSKLNASIEGRLRFYDASLLKFDEVIFFQGRQIIKLHYAYHYQDSAGKLVFRYDNASHHPHILTYPHHKHSGTDVEPAQVPDLSEVLREIEGLIYSAD